MRRNKLKQYVFPVFTFFLGMYLSPIIYPMFDEPTNSSMETRKMTKETDSTELLIMIVSAPQNADKRNAIRETWLSSHHSEIRGYFVIGVLGVSNTVMKSMEEEKEEFDDMIFLNMKDSYDRLTEKVLRMIEYADEHFQARLMMKCDDDTFVNVYQLAKEIKLPSYHSDIIYWGYFDGRAPVQKKGKWAEADYNLCDRYIPYALGGGYIIGWQIVKHIARSGTMLEMYKNEDVSVGTWLAGVSVKRIHDERFDTEWKSRGCLDIFLVTQNKSPEDMKTLWSRLTSGASLCSKEVINRRSYSYNWNVLPSQCCVRGE